MKIAGQKNDGAWFRANAALFGNVRLGIQPMDPAERANLTAIIQTSDFLDAAFNALTDLMAETGVEIQGFPENKGEWVARMIQDAGIPRQIWNGHLTFTTYTLAGAVGARTATANYQSEFHYFAKDLRKMVTRFIKARRELMDLTDLGSLGMGNPGGMPDARIDGGA